VKLSYQNFSILVVDAVRQAVDTINEFLSEFRFHRVWTASSAQEAWEVLSERPVDLLITNWRMRPMSGLQLIERLRGHPRLGKLPVLVIRDRQDTHIEEQAKRLQVTGYLYTPLEAAAVRQAVEAVLEPMVDPQEEAFLTAMAQGREHMRRQRWEDAAAGYRSALEIREHEDAYMGLARALAAAGDRPGARQAFMQALRHNPKNLLAFDGLAQLYLEEGQLKEAAKVLSGALRMAQREEADAVTQADLLYRLGEVALSLENIAETVERFDQASRLLAEDINFQIRLGDRLAEAGHYAEAVEFYRRALELDPSLAHTANRLGMAYRRQRRYGRALSLYQRALVFHPQDDHLHYNIARVYWEIGQWRPAAQILVRALRLNPEFREARRLLDAVLEKLGFVRDEQGRLVRQGGS
jgi:tetratricopeptide (TPR) repeat protein